MRCAKRLTEGRHSCAGRIGVAEHQNGLGNQQVHQHQQVYRGSTIIDVSEHHQRVGDGKDTTVWRTTPARRRRQHQRFGVQDHQHVGERQAAMSTSRAHSNTR